MGKKAYRSLFSSKQKHIYTIYNINKLVATENLTHLYFCTEKIQKKEKKLLSSEKREKIAIIINGLSKKNYKTPVRNHQHPPSPQIIFSVCCSPGPWI